MKRWQQIWAGPSLSPPHLDKIQKKSSFYSGRVPKRGALWTEESRPLPTMTTMIAVEDSGVALKPGTGCFSPSLQHDCNAKNLLLLSTLHSATLSPRSWWYLPQGAPSRFCARRSFGAHQVRFDGTLGLPSLFSSQPLFSTAVYRTGASLLVVCQACKVQNHHYF